MDFFDFAKKAAKTVLKEATIQSSSTIGGKSVSQWDREWVCVYCKIKM